MGRRALPGLLAAALLLAAATAAAHGPTVNVSIGRVKPVQLAIPKGATVHFQYRASTGTCTLVADDGSFEGPTLAPGEGWHHTFEEPGSYSYSVRENSGARGTILVAE